jgi:uncharacterized protein (DUF885 family)
MSKLYTVRHAKEAKILSKMLHLSAKYEQQKEVYENTKKQVKDIEAQMDELASSLGIVGDSMNIEYINNINKRKFWLSYDHEKYSYYLKKEKNELNEAYNEYADVKNAYNQCKIKNQEIDKKRKNIRREMNKKVEQILDDELIDSNYSKSTGV